ncbi:cell morphogenesis protein Las1 [Penicillium brasilianum]|uniref:Cell morphogenesis protein Las1 n=1 Tax=Penicillium brasilianum TaxID=104259 RepID=A0A1S9R9P9_PENBI|nr:cell morphogenesis protein Las1 [Penicillium brasilianum]
MAKVTFTAWKTKAQLLDVRSEFYPPTWYTGPDRRSHACATVEAWKLRGNVPHHVEATALLTDAILHDDGQRNSIFSIRATYSAAFCRFVTGLVDTKVTGPRRTMFQRAMDLGLPASFVELRHEATHREPPSLVVLRKATQRSLEWLWDNYWANIDLDVIGGVLQYNRDESLPITTVLGEVLQEFVHGSGSRPAQKKRKREHEDGIAGRLLEICGMSRDGIDAGLAALSVLLLDLKLLFDSERRLGDSMNAMFDKWDPVLQKVADGHSPFLLFLSEELVHKLALNPATESPENTVDEGIFLWLDHLLNSPAWELRRQYLPRDYIIAVCNSQPSHWAKMMAQNLQLQQQGSAAVVPRRQMTVNKSSNKQAHTVSDGEFSRKLQGHGWGLAEKWDNRPLGMTLKI